jgi:2-polyprenyl-3-methyl-5-hydroxy-6-metoxy-1,4-benzoquinol methylase
MTQTPPTSPLPSLRDQPALRVLHVRTDRAVASSWGVRTNDATIWQCPRTGIRFRSAPEQPQTVTEFYADDYHDSMTGRASNDMRRRAYQKENSIRARDLKRHLPGGRVLDVGCSQGHFGAALAEVGFDAYGLDIAPEAHKQASVRLGPDRVFLESLENLAARTQQRFSAVTMMDVIEHCVDVVSFLDAAHRVLEPGGILFLRTPTLSSPFHTLGTLSYRLSLGLYKTALLKLYHAEHLYFFNETGLRQLLDECGFDTLDVMADPLCWDNFRTAELRQGILGNLVLSMTYFAGRALGRGHGMKVMARRRESRQYAIGSP